MRRKAERKAYNVGTLSGSLAIALGALAADQGAVAITSNNIANVNTAGYSRQQINLSENPPVQLGNLLFGTGVTLSQTASIRDNLLERRLDQENQSAGQLDAFLGPMNQPVKAEARNYYLDSIFGEKRLTDWVNLGGGILLTLIVGGAL